MNDIYLTAHEKWILFFMRFKKKSAIKESDAYSLLKFRLIERNYLSETDELGCCIWDGTFSLTDEYTRFRIAKREYHFKRLVTPITVTVLTNIVLYGLQWLIKWLQSLL